MKEHIPKIIQVTIGLGILVMTLMHFERNEIGQNIINVTCSAIFFIGLENIIMIYCCCTNKQGVEFQATFAIFCLQMMGILFQKFHRSPNYFGQFNTFCYITISVVLIINFLYLFAIFVILAAYFFRQIYRLMTETLLSPSSNIQAAELQAIMNMKKQFSEIMEENPAVNTICSICLSEFQDENISIILPGCSHCFHADCIEQWLSTKSTCPYCRYNIRLNVM